LSENGAKNGLKSQRLVRGGAGGKVMRENEPALLVLSTYDGKLFLRKVKFYLRNVSKACKRQSREHPTPLAYPEERREEILRAYEERSSLRGLERTFGVSRTSVIGWIKKSRKAARAERNGAHT
jgi:hypothetical protein